jgi:hypothetical protein
MFVGDSTQAQWFERIGPPANSKELKPLLQELLASRTDTPLLLSAQLLAARLGLVPIDPDFSARGFTAVDEPEATRLQVLDALIAFVIRRCLVCCRKQSLPVHRVSCNGSSSPSDAWKTRSWRMFFSANIPNLHLNCSPRD